MSLQEFLIKEGGSKVASQSMVDEIASYTDSNDHFEARVQLCGMMGDIEFQTIYQSLQTLHEKYRNPYAVKLRDHMEKELTKKIKRHFANWKDMHMAL